MTWHENLSLGFLYPSLPLFTGPIKGTELLVKQSNKAMMEYTTVPRYSLNVYSFSWSKSFFGQPHFYFLYTAHYYLINSGVRAAWVRTGTKWTLIVIFLQRWLWLWTLVVIFPVLRFPPSPSHTGREKSKLQNKSHQPRCIQRLGESIWGRTIWAGALFALEQKTEAGYETEQWDNVSQTYTTFHSRSEKAKFTKLPH